MSMEGSNHIIELTVDYIIEQKNNLAKSTIRTRNLRDVIIDAIGTTLLHHAAAAGNVEIVNFLLGLGANIDAQDHYGFTPLNQLVHDEADEDIRVEDLSIIETLLLSGSNYCLHNYLGVSALQRACKLRMTNDVRRTLAIIKLFVDKVKKNCASNGELMAKMLMDNDCSLERAMLANNADLTKAMIARGCSVDQRLCATGTTALHAAVNLMCLDNVRALIEHGADVYAEDDGGLTPLQYYCKTGYYNEAASDNEEPEIVSIMMNKIKDVNKCSRGRFIVESVAARGNEKAAKILLQYDLDFHAQDDSKNTLLYYFAINPYTNVVTLMKGTKLNLALRGTQGSIMLARAVTDANTHTVRFLLEIGANPNFVTPDFHVPALYFALNSFRDRMGSPETVECIALLLEYGAKVQWKYYTSIFTVLQTVPNSGEVAKMVIERLAIDEVSGKSITDETRGQVRSEETLRDYFNQCKQNLEDMSKIVVFGSLTMLSFLTENEESILRRYAYNQDFLKKLESMNSKIGPFLYYDQLLHERIARMIKLIHK